MKDKTIIEQATDTILKAVHEYLQEFTKVVNGGPGVSLISLRIESIKMQVAEEHSISVDDLMGDSRKAAIIKARAAAYRRCRKETGATLKTVAAAFNKNHSTVIHALDRYA